MDDPSEKLGAHLPSFVASSSAWRGCANAVAAPIVLVVLFVAVQYVSVARDARIPPPGRPGDRADQLQDRVDPNTAPWWELTILPGVGEVTARAIVEHRRQAREGGDARPFDGANDLENVRGIGPKTVERFRALLRFDDDGGSARHSNPSAPLQSEGR